jgi:small subunit ribosomal protein S18
MRTSIKQKRFSKRRPRRKTSFPVIAIIPKKLKPNYISVESFFAPPAKIVPPAKIAPSVAPSVAPSDAPSDKIAPSAKIAPSVAPSDKIAPSDAPSDKIAPSAKIVPSATIAPSVAPSDKRKDNKRNEKSPVVRSRKKVKKSRAIIDYKNGILLRKLITAGGKILPRRINKLTAKQQRYTSKAIKSARILGFLPFTNHTRPV